MLIPRQILLDYIYRKLHTLTAVVRVVIVNRLDVLVLVAAADVGCMADGLDILGEEVVSCERIIFRIVSLRQQFAFWTGVTPE